MAPKGTISETVRVFGTILGLDEKPPGSNCNKLTDWYGMGCVPWCAIGLSWVFDKADVAVPRFAYTPAGAQWFQDQGRGFTDDSKARLGDVAFFDFPDSLNRIQHVGLVLENPVGGLVLTRECNTSSGQAGSQDDGGGVYDRERAESAVVYFGRPPYVDEEEELPRFAYPKARAWFGKGDTGADVRTWELDLNRWMRHLRNHKKNLKFDFGTINADGRFNRETVQATKTFQAFYELDVDGRVGAATIRRMERVRSRQKAA